MERPPCPDCGECPTGRCLESEHAFEMIRRAHAEATHTDRYDGDGEHALTEATYSPE